MLRSKHTQGSALITALFIMALIAAAATALIYQQQLTIANAQRSFNYSQALQYNQLVTNWALDTLKQSLLSSNTGTPIDTIPALYPTTEIPGGQYRGVLFDMQAKFNLNNLSNPTTAAGFTNMLKVVLPNVPNPQSITLAISNYVSARGVLDPSYDLAYQKAGLTYLPPHRFMLTVSELRSVVGVTQAIYQGLIPYVTVLPKNNTTLNINTASVQALTSVAPDISLETAQAIAQTRPYTSNNDISTNPIIKNHDNIANAFTISSDFFLARSLVQIGSQQLLTNSYIVRDPLQKIALVLYQTQGSSE